MTFRFPLILSAVLTSLVLCLSPQSVLADEESRVVYCTENSMSPCAGWKVGSVAMFNGNLVSCEMHGDVNAEKSWTGIVYFYADCEVVIRDTGI